MHEAEAAASAPLVAIVHGSLDRSTSFSRLERQLGGMAVARYDRRGYGRSVGAGLAAGVGDQIDDLAAVLAGRPGIVLGHSIGGVIALALAQRDPALVRAVVAYEAPMSWLPWWPSVSAGGGALAGDGGPADAAERFMRRMIGDDRWGRLPPSTRELRREEGPALVADLRSIRPPAPAPYEPSLVEVPVVAARGSESAPHHRRAAELLAEEAPQGELHEIAGADHGAHLTHPAELAALVQRAVELSGA